MEEKLLVAVDKLNVEVKDCVHVSAAGIITVEGCHPVVTSQSQGTSSQIPLKSRQMSRITACAQKGDYLATAESQTSHILLWNTRTMKLHKRMPGHSQKILNLTFNAMASRLFSLDKGGLLIAWSTHMAKEIDRLALEEESLASDLICVDSRILGALSHKIGVWNLPAPSLPDLPESSSNSSKGSPKNSESLNSPDMKLKRLPDVSTHLEPFEPALNPQCLAHFGSTLYCGSTCGVLASFQEYKLKKSRQLGNCQLTKLVPREGQLVVGGSDGSVFLVETPSLDILQSIGLKSPIVGISLYNELMVVTSNDGHIYRVTPKACQRSEASSGYLDDEFYSEPKSFFQTPWQSVLSSRLQVTLVEKGSVDKLAQLKRKKAVPQTLLGRWFG